MMQSKPAIGPVQVPCAGPVQLQIYGKFAPAWEWGMLSQGMCSPCWIQPWEDSCIGPKLADAGNQEREQQDRWIAFPVAGVQGAGGATKSWQLY